MGFWILDFGPFALRQAQDAQGKFWDEVVMPSPFPGMDPYLEGDLWPDVHHALAEEIRRRLAAKIAPRYVARIALRFVADSFEEEGGNVGIVLPDVEVLPSRPLTGGRLEPAAQGDEGIMAAPLVLPLPATVRVRLASVQIRDAANRELVTSIEILSPVNKRGSGWDEYQRKRQVVMRSNAHLLEIDLLRRGRRPLGETKLPPAPYFAFLTRAPLRQIEIWPIALADKLPTLPVPLLEPDLDVALNLQDAVATVYEEARYDLDIDYGRPPEPPLEGEDTTWAAQLLGTT